MDKFKFRLFNYKTGEIKYFILMDIQKNKIKLTDDIYISIGVDIGGQYFYDRDFVKVVYPNNTIKEGVVKFFRGMFVIDFGNGMELIHDLIRNDCNINIIGNFYEYISQFM